MTDAYRNDEDLLRSLGLPTTGFGREWTELGVVTVVEADPDGSYGPRPATTVKVEVSAMPAQFWRLTVTRPRDDAETLPNGTVRGVYEPLEVVVIETGSGFFSKYWPVAVLVAEHMITVEGVR